MSEEIDPMQLLMARLEACAQSPEALTTLRDELPRAFQYGPELYLHELELGKGAQSEADADLQNHLKRVLEKK